LDADERESMTAKSLFAYSLQPLAYRLKCWWLGILERHYLICAEVEAERANEAQRNAAYYQRRAAFARSSIWRVR
jgi:hypothetical protein